MVAGPTPRTGSLVQTVQGLIGTFYRGDPLLLAGTDFPVSRPLWKNFSRKIVRSFGMMSVNRTLSYLRKKWSRRLFSSFPIGRRYFMFTSMHRALLSSLSLRSQEKDTLTTHSPLQVGNSQMRNTTTPP